MQRRLGGFLAAVLMVGAIVAVPARAGAADPQVVAVTPSVGLVDGQTVTATGSGFTSDTTFGGLVVGVCLSAEANGSLNADELCSSTASFPVPVDATGHFSTPVTVFRKSMSVVNTPVDCTTGPNACIMFAYQIIGLVGGRIPQIIFASAPISFRTETPVNVAAIQAGVQDACTHKALPAVQTTLTDATGLPIAPTHVGKSTFKYQTLAPGTYRVSVTSPGYEDLADQTGNPGVPITVNPGPTQVPAEDTITQGLHLGIRLVPLFPPNPCNNPGPPGVPALVGIVHDITTRKPITGLTGAITGAADPGPVRFGTGHLAAPHLPASTWNLTLSAPGYVALPGVQITTNPGPIQSPPDAHGLSSTVATGLKLGIALGPPAPGA